MHVSKSILVVAGLVILLLTAALAYMAGRSIEVAPPAKPTTEPTRPTSRDQVVERALVKANEKETALLEQEKAVDSARILLGKLSGADSNDLEMGCRGTFTQKKNDILYVSAGTLVLRPDQRRLLAPVNDEQFQAFADDDATVTVEGYRIRLAPRGPTKPGLDGHNANAVLTISRGSRATSYNGSWSFQC